jgi:lysophospholipase L1-like esterase
MKRTTLLAVTLAVCLVAAAPVAASAAAAPKVKYTLSLGDSFSAGVQPGQGVKQSFSYPKVSYANQMLSRASRVLKQKLSMQMLACGGATTQSMTGADIKPCDPGVGGFKLPYKNTSPKTSQLQYALDFLKKHKGQVAYVTMTMGGNNLLKCVDSTTGGFDLNCITASYTSIKAELPAIAKKIKKAAGPGVQLLGSGYPDPYLQFYLRGPDQQAIAQASLGIQAQLDKTLEESYGSAGWKFVDVDPLFGTNIPLSQTTNLDPYGQIPTAVANICEYTWMCAPAPMGPNIHPDQAGYALYAAANLKVLKDEK